MTTPEQPEMTSSDSDRARTIQAVIDEGREAELSEDDYQFAIENGLIEG